MYFVIGRFPASAVVNLVKELGIGCQVTVREKEGNWCAIQGDDCKTLKENLAKMIIINNNNSNYNLTFSKIDYGVGKRKIGCQ